jgi:hypothetical protein
MSKYVNPVQETLQYSDEWIELGVITPEVEGELWHEWQQGEDHHPEHYRWRAFSDFLKVHSSLSEDSFAALYALAESDHDPVMGLAMQGDLLIRNDCPQALLERALASSQIHLVKVAQRVLSRRHQTPSA